MRIPTSELLHSSSQVTTLCHEGNSILPTKVACAYFQTANSPDWMYAMRSLLSSSVFYMNSTSISEIYIIVIHWRDFRCCCFSNNKDSFLEKKTLL